MNLKTVTLLFDNQNVIGDGTNIVYLHGPKIVQVCKGEYVTRQSWAEFINGPIGSFLVEYGKISPIEPSSN